MIIINQLIMKTTYHLDRYFQSILGYIGIVLVLCKFHVHSLDYRQLKD